MRSSTDLLISILSLLILLLLLSRAGMKTGNPVPPQRITIEGRMTEIQRAALSTSHSSTMQKVLGGSTSTPSAAWDRALCSILEAEKGDLAKARSLALEGPLPAGPAGDPFRRCWSSAYLGEAVPGPLDRAAVNQALRNGYAARLLEARLEERMGHAPDALRQQAEAWANSRIRILAGLGILGLLALVSSPLFAGLLAVKWKRPNAPPAPELTGRALLLLLLGWFLAYLLSGTVAQILVTLIPPLRPLGAPMAYAFHACVGLGLLCGLQGLHWRELAQRLSAGSSPLGLPWALGFLILAVGAVMATAWALSPVLPHQEAPQRDLVEMITNPSSPWRLIPFVLLATVIAPVFEEIFFRGALLPWLGSRLQPRLGSFRGWTLALFLSGLAFALIHLEPSALPALFVLGTVLGLAFLRTGSLMTPIVVHGLWNGGILVFYRTFLT